jgi:hypothetical protein
MRNIEKIAEELFNKIRSRFERVTIGDEEGKATDDPRAARFYNFDYISRDGTNYGEITVSIVDGKSLKITFSQGMVHGFDPDQEVEWENFLRNMRKFARRNMIQFDVRDISRSNLTQRDIDQQVTNTGSYTAKEKPVTEAVQWSGTTRTSIQDFGATRLIVRHTEAVNEESPGARSRKIESMFIETAEGERFRMPYNRLSLGRAMAQHLAHGGRIYDDAGEHIVGMAEEMSNLSFFVRNTRHRTFEDVETQGMVEAAVERYQILKNSLRGMVSTRGYQRWAEAFRPSVPADEQYDIEALKERFVKKMFDDRLTDALPYVYRAYQTRSAEQANPLVREFQGWAEQITQEASAPETADPDQLSKLLAQPLIAGPDGLDAIAALSGVIDNEDLNDQIRQAVTVSGPDADVRRVIDQWFERNLDSYTSMMPAETPPAAELPTEPEPEPPSNPARAESVDALRRLAGLTRK